MGWKSRKASWRRCQQSWVYRMMTYTGKRDAPLVLGNALIRGKLARNNLNSVNYRSLSMKYEPASASSSFVLYFNDWTGINRANQTRISEANQFFDHPKSKIQILHIQFTNCHQLETTGPQKLFLCFILISVIGFLTVGLELKMEGQVKSLWVWLD